MNLYPVLIGGCPRSGTTALAQLMNSNPSVHITLEENIIQTAQALRKTLGTRERRSEIYREKGMRALSDRETLDMRDALNRNFSAGSVWPVIKFIYEWHHKKIHPDSPLLVWGDKFPKYFESIEKTVTELDGVKYIHVSRNPFDVINSMMRRTEMAKQGKDWWKAVTDFDDMVDVWCSAYRSIREIESRKNVLHMNYEELLFDYENTIERLNNFLGVSLTYDDILVKDPSMHFDRSYLDSSMIKNISGREDVKSYVKSWKNNSCAMWFAGLHEFI